MDSSAVLNTIQSPSTKALPKSSKYDRKPLACSSCITNPIMTVRYSEQVLPGCIRFYDDSLNPQIDSFDYVYAGSSKSKQSQRLPNSRIQPQRRLSADVDMCDYRPPLLPRKPTYNLDRPRNEVQRPVVMEPNPHAPPPISLPSSSHQSLPRLCLMERKPLPSAIPLHEPRPLTVENLARFNMQEHLHPAPRHLSDQQTLILHPPPLHRRIHALPSIPPSVRQPQHIPISLMSNPWIRSIITTIRSSCAQLLVRERQEKEEIRQELHELKRSMKRPLREGRRSPYSRESSCSSSRASDELQYLASTPKRRRLSVSSEDGLKPVLQVLEPALRDHAAVLVPLVEDAMEPQVKEEEVKVHVTEAAAEAIRGEEAPAPASPSYLRVPVSVPALVPWTQDSDGMGECDMDLESDSDPELEEGEIYEDRSLVSPSPSDSSGVTLVEAVENKWLNMVMIR
ncbi:uncharacterized protein BT62DRAFT_736686 [Guyanagaster necrorhizus]|uniref:Uncharacterized protein n=1 Tax=Guyanagaster necrorhizus TaxID=856835 RepID=A0A9P8ALA8_9AGAR|nr:uncharacterized protein BT62DRAFT_736686 [Guyanagaster necrorhizus MCA 3950]KAG7439446.1 hypothetical protein BT62DRAFT_736686 [Guyanagaster necrorhizus MCA 3950]